MNIISNRFEGLSRLALGRKLISEGSLVMRLAHISFACLLLLLAACGFDGPWKFYPEERDIYAGIYTYGYIIDGKSPYVCFSKTYQLDETAAEDFAFYDSAYVVVENLGDSTISGKGDSVYYPKAELVPQGKTPNCFTVSGADSFVGEIGGKYRLHAFFRWDSAGYDVESEFFAEAVIPSGFDFEGVNVPLKGGEYEWHDIHMKNTDVFSAEDWLEVDFLEYPEDVNLYKFVPKYNDSIGGIFVYLDMDVHDGGESMNTTIAYIQEAFMETDSMGYKGMSLHDALEGKAHLGYEENRRVAGLNMLDTIFLPNMNLPLGDFMIHFLATDKAYSQYERYVLGSLDDPRVIPESNIENGMGVFSGMAHLQLPMHMNGNGVDYWYIARANCKNGSGGDSDGWDTKSCRLYQDVLCSGAYKDFYGDEDALYDLNENAYKYYRDRDDSTLSLMENVFCYAPAVKAAMMLDTTSWSIFLPKDIEEKDKNNAYGDALKRYCVASNFKTNKIADCSEMEKDCLEDLEKTGCKEYLWEWCSDRNWNVSKYPQCESGLVSRYYLENQKSSILEREVKKICKDKSIKQCERE